IKDAAEPHMQRPRDDGDVLNAGMPMRWDLEVGRELEPKHDRHGLIQRPFDDRDLYPRQGWQILPGQLRGIEHDVALGVLGRCHLWAQQRACESKANCCELHVVSSKSFLKV